MGNAETQFRGDRCVEVGLPGEAIEGLTQWVNERV